MSSTGSCFIPTNFEKLKFSVEFFDRDKAMEALSCNTGNRPTNRRAIERFISALVAREVVPVPDCIGYAIDGRLINGQHRLLAIAESGIGAWLCVIRGFPFDETFAACDDVNTRKFADRLACLGLSHPKSRAAILMHVWRWEAGVLSWAQTFSTSFTKADQVGLAERHDVSASAAWMESQNRTHLGKAVSGFMHYITNRVLPAKAGPFWEAVRTGEGLVRGDPAYVLRERLMKSQNKVGRIDDRIRLMFHIQAWNAEAEGRRIMILRETPDWPEIVGAPMPTRNEKPKSEKAKP